MDSIGTVIESRNRGEAVRDEVVAVGLGAAFTLVLFFGMAHFEHFGRNESPPVVEELRLVSLPPEQPPPPPPVPSVQSPAEFQPFAGLEVEAADSPVSIAVVPPDLETLFPPTTKLPAAKLQVAALYSDFKPKMDLLAESRHVYQESEVDQKTRALVRDLPPIPAEISDTAQSLEVVLVMVIDEQGRATNVRPLRSSGNPKFDELAARAVQEEWMFAPAMRRGKKVKVLAQQSVRANFGRGTSPFNLDR